MNDLLTWALSVTLLLAAIGYSARRTRQDPRPTPLVPQMRNGRQNRWYR